LPLVQWLPAAHGGLVPQRQVPVAGSQIGELVASQAMHVSPSMPQAIAEGGDMQTPFAQHPVGHEAWLQTQLPPRQTVPAGQAGLVPQRQVPVVASHVSDISAGHAAQLAPPRPQAPSSGSLQAPFAQQPVGHEVASQTHAPPGAQRFPAPHAGCPPQVQTPASEQPSARDGSHATHAAPPAPQAWSNPLSVHIVPEQHPSQLAEVQALQTPLMHVPPPQFRHLPPPVPHAAGSVPTTQLEPEQQPPAHEAPSQTQVPSLQRAPSVHIGPVPQRHTPFCVQPSALIPQSRQADAPEPQVPTVGVRQIFPSQQPLGQDLESQIQLPDEQRWPAAQAGPAPQPHEPAAVQLSATVGPQSAHVPPAAPQ
jgi:hypothetical protein